MDAVSPAAAPSPEAVTTPTAGPFPAPQVDGFLQSLVDLMNRTPLEVGITLSVNGLTISGMMISGRRYFEMLGDSVASSLTDQPTIAESLRQYCSMPASLYPAAGETADADRPPPFFIHLRDARIFHNSGAPLPTNQGVLWRGKLTDVSGFFIGSMSQL
jgi:hypothetical protein